MGTTSVPVLAVGWESGEDSQGQSTSNIGTITTTGARTGTYGLSLGKGDAWTSQNYITPETGASASLSIVGMSFSFYIETWTYTAGDAPFLAAPRASNSQPYLYLAEDGGNKKLKLCSGDGGSSTLGTTVWTSNTTLATATVYVVELCGYNSAGSTSTNNWPHRVKLFSNAGVLLDDSGWVDTTLGNGSSQGSTNSCGLGPGHVSSRIAAGSAYAITFDDLLVTYGPPPRGAKILALFPNATGTDTAWTGDYTAVDDVPPGGDFLTTGSGGQSETHNFPASGLTLTSPDRNSASNIICVVEWLYGNRSGGTIKSFSLRLRNAAGASISPAQYVFGTTLGYYSWIVPGDWTATDGGVTDIDTFEWGITSQTSLGVGNFQVDQNFVEICYGPDTEASSGTTLNEVLDTTETVVTVTDGTKFTAGDLIQIDEEWMSVSSISSNDLTVVRGKWTTPAAHVTGLTIYKHPWFNRQRGSV